MKRLSDNVINLINELHTERLEYDSEYLPLIEAAIKLAAYEDTELEPDELQDSVDLVLELNKKIKPYMDAEKDGRLVILPCKIGQRVYKVFETYYTLPLCTACGKYGGMESCAYLKNDEKTSACTSKLRDSSDGRIIGVVSLMFDMSLLPDFGKTVFLTSEEAEDAMESMIRL